MSENQFKLLSGGFDEKGNPLYLIKDTTDMIGDYEICNKVIEQQATISKQLDQIIELQDKYRILEFNHSRLEKRNKAQYEKIGEQQANISRLKEENEEYAKIIEQSKRYEDGLWFRFTKLEKENEKLRQMIKENVFQRYREGSLADLEFKAIAYDDIIKIKVSDESEPKVIVYCKQGKKENIMSFCQMFIPFGIAYEIKEVINDE